jgi:hypothetical protein
MLQAIRSDGAGGGTHAARNHHAKDEARSVKLFASIRHVLQNVAGILQNGAVRV